jgi:hypothetical protein
LHRQCFSCTWPPAAPAPPSPYLTGACEVHRFGYFAAPFFSQPAARRKPPSPTVVAMHAIIAGNSISRVWWIYGHARSTCTHAGARGGEEAAAARAIHARHDVHQRAEVVRPADRRSAREIPPRRAAQGPGPPRGAGHVQGNDALCVSVCCRCDAGVHVGFRHDGCCRCGCCCCF